jgi:formylglycine-generating enzyme required for sulfatase activity
MKKERAKKNESQEVDVPKPKNSGDKAKKKATNKRQKDQDCDCDCQCENPDTLLITKLKRLNVRLRKFRKDYNKIRRKISKRWKKRVKVWKRATKRWIKRGIKSGLIPIAISSMSIVFVLVFILFHKAETKNLPTQIRTFTVSGVVFDMIMVHDGSFTMGCVDARSNENGIDNSNERPNSIVTISSFYMGKYQVTQALWKAVMNNRNPSSIIGDELPVHNVSWNEVQNFIKRLNDLTGLKFRLPTEAEWEYAARGGTRSFGYRFSGSNNLNEVAWFSNNTMDKEVRMQPVGTKNANELGIYDMSGNVWEWVSDWFGEYTRESKLNPTGPEEGTLRVNRGGSWSSMEHMCRITARGSTAPTLRYDNLGFRLALH